MEILKKGSMPSKIAKTLSWLMAGGIALWAAEVVDKQKTDRAVWNELPGMVTGIQRIWIEETGNVDSLNRLAIKKAKELNLQPGEPLPPTLFFKEGDPLRENFIDNQKTQIVREYTVTSGGLRARAEITISVNNVAPSTQNPYAAALILADPKILDNGFQIFPNKTGARELVSLGIKDIEIKKGKTGKFKSNEPKP